MKTNRMCSRALTWPRSSHGKWGTVVKTAPVCQGMLQTMITQATSQPVRPGFCSGTSEPPFGGRMTSPCFLKEKEEPTNSQAFVRFKGNSTLPNPGDCRLYQRSHSPSLSKGTNVYRRCLLAYQRACCPPCLSVPVTLLNLLPPQTSLAHGLPLPSFPSP